MEVSVVCCAVVTVLALVIGSGAACSIKPEEACATESKHLYVIYGGTNVSCNDNLTQAEASTVPKVKFPGAELNSNYIILMVDPDAPGSTTGTAWLHWIAEIDGNSLEGGSSGTPTVEYNGPTPPSGTHRYVFYAIKKTKPTATKPASGSKRDRFNYVEYIGKRGKVKATNMFKVTV